MADWFEGGRFVPKQGGTKIEYYGQRVVRFRGIEDAKQKDEFVFRG